MPPLLLDPWFYLATIPCLLIIGISKGGFGAGLAMLGVPILSLVMEVKTAAGILLPVLCLMDIFGLYFYKNKQWSFEILKDMVPAALFGILVGGFLLDYLPDWIVKIMVGCLAVLFFLYSRFSIPSLSLKLGLGWMKYVWSFLSGFASTVAHAGGPPSNIYLLPLKLPKTLFVGTTVYFFAIVNYAKLIPYGYLGLLSMENIWVSVAVMPLAPIGFMMGIWIKNKLNEDMFYRVCYWSLLIMGVKLCYDGLKVI